MTAIQGAIVGAFVSYGEDFNELGQKYGQPRP